MQTNPENVWCNGSLPVPEPGHQSHHGSLKALARIALQSNRPNEVPSSWNAGACGSTGAAGSLQNADAKLSEKHRTHLLALATAEHIDAAHVYHLHELDVVGCIGLDSCQLATCLSMLADTADRHAGRVPASDTTAIHCRQCGLVWVHPAMANVLPVVGGWPHALGCPWCFVRKTGGYIPRPLRTMPHQAPIDE